MAEPTIATSVVSVDVTVQGLANGLTLAGVDSGVRAILSEGAGGVEIAASLIDRGLGDRRVSLRDNAGGFTQGVPFDWTVEGTFRITRDPDPNKRGTLTVAGFPPEVLADVDLLAARRASANFEFGCAADPATVTAFFGPIGPQAPSVFPLAVTPTFAALAPNRIQGVAIAGRFTLDPASNGIDPAIEMVALRLFMPGGARIYPVGTDFMPVAMQPFSFGPGGWRITNAERARTGIEFFAIERTPDPRRFRFQLGDAFSSLPAADYSQVRVDLAIGDDQGGADMNLTESRGVWHLG